MPNGGLPENFAFMGMTPAGWSWRQPGGSMQPLPVTMARRYQVVLLGGGFPFRLAMDHTLNRAELVDRDGQCLARYDKIHLFDVDLPDGGTYRESATVTPGDHLPPVVDVPGLCRLGGPSVTTCASLGAVLSRRRRS